MSIAAGIRDRVVAADPGLTRFYMALRATAGVGVALSILLWISGRYHLPLTVPLLGAAIGMTWSIGVNDADPKAQRATTLLLWLPAAAALTLGTATAGNRIVGDLVFLAVLFLSVYVRKYGPRGYAAGMVSVLTFFFALFLHATFALLPWLLLSLAVTMVCSYVLRFVVFPDSPARALQNAGDAFRARQRLIAQTIAQAAERAEWTDGLRRQLQHHLFRLNESALALDDILSDTGEDDLRASVLDAELRTEAMTKRALRNPRISVELPHVELSVERLRTRHWTPRGAFRVGTQIDTGRLTPLTRQAIQLCAAGAASIVVGELLSPQRWYWAVLTAFVVFSGTSSSGETLKKALSRFSGTAFGVAAGIVVGTMVHGDKVAATVLLFVCLFAAVYVIRVSYALMIFFITALLSLLYVLLGLFTDHLLVLRLIETGIGAAFGGLAARLVLPIRTRAVVGNVAIEGLARLKEVVHQSVECLGGDGKADPVTAARAYDESLQSIRTQLQPLIGTIRPGGNEEMRTRLLLFAACGYYGRALATLAHEAPDNCPMRDIERERDAVELSIESVIGILEGTHSAPPDGRTMAETTGVRALNYLYRIERAVRRIGQTLAASA